MWYKRVQRSSSHMLFNHVKFEPTGLRNIDELLFIFTFWKYLTRSYHVSGSMYLCPVFKVLNQSYTGTDTFLHIYLFYMYVCIPEYMYVHPICAEARRGLHIPWSWRCRWLWAACHRCWNWTQSSASVASNLSPRASSSTPLLFF